MSIQLPPLATPKLSELLRVSSLPSLLRLGRLEREVTRCYRGRTEPDTIVGNIGIAVELTVIEGTRPFVGISTIS